MLCVTSFTEKDRLLRRDYPKVDRAHRQMSDAESQERMILWKLRCSASRQMSSPGGIILNGDASGQGTRTNDINENSRSTFETYCRHFKKECTGN